MPDGLALAVVAGELAVARLEPGAPLPEWARPDGGALHAVVRTAGEVSVVCAAERVPGDVRAESAWRALRVAGPLDFALTGVLAAITAPLADAGVSIFAMSTFDTDYVLVPAGRLEAAVRALRAAGHRVGDG